MPRKRSFKRIQARLQARRKELLRSLSNGLNETHRSVLYRATDSPEMASASAESDMIFHFVEMESDELEQIEDALERIRLGAYGQCEACGEPISRARLEAIPWATLCVRCKAALEAGELIGRNEDARWDRVEAFERDESDLMAMAVERGEKVS